MEMTYRDLFYKATRLIDKGEITLGEYEEMTKPLDREIEQEPKQGHWIMVSDRTDWYDATFKCSCCDREIITPYELKDDIYNDYPYCHCGARMSEVSE